MCALLVVLASAACVLAPVALGKTPRLGDRLPMGSGMSGKDVRVLQGLLRRAGFRITADGQFGRRTVRVIRRFERRAGLAVNGAVDAADIEALRALVRSGGQPAAAVAPAAVPAPESATIGPDGLAIPPATAPEVVKQIIAAGNEIATKPYRYGGGHARWNDTGYDCSGSVSYALHGAGLLERAMPSGGFTSWGESGPGQWVTIYAHGGHMYMVVAGLRFDTSGRSKAGTRWQAEERSPSGFTARHPLGL
jgi:hypothetical protein